MQRSTALGILSLHCTSLAVVAMSLTCMTAQAATPVAAGAGTQGLNGTNANYDVKAILGNRTALTDWHPRRHSFKMSLGGVATTNRSSPTKDWQLLRVGLAWRL
jgi:hypothetical protein